MDYLASPYSHDSAAMRKWRFHKACEAAGILMQRGHIVFSPIAHSHPIAMQGTLPTRWEFWALYDEEFIRRCERLLILTLPGWLLSTGIAGETKIAERLKLPIQHVDPKELGMDISHYYRILANWRKHRRETNNKL